MSVFSVSKYKSSRFVFLEFCFHKAFTKHGDVMGNLPLSARDVCCLLVCLLVGWLVGWFVGWLLNVPATSQGRICSDNFTCCHTEIEVADQTVHLAQSQYTDTGPINPSTDHITPGPWQGSHWIANFDVSCTIRPQKNPVASGIRTRNLPLPMRTP